MKYNTIFASDSHTEPQTLSESLEKAAKELSYLDTLVSKAPVNLSPFQKTEITISPSEFVTKFIQEQFK